jgi:hypothetical protein
LTYTCINWLRTEPYVGAWAEKYKGKGLIVIGVHSPEFKFEKDIGNVRRALQELKVDYPIAVDSDHNIWNAFANQYWPALYFVDAQGRIRHHQFGEGDYEESERVIQKLLSEAGNANVGADKVSVTGEGIKASADWKTLGTPENYIGYGRTVNFSSPEGLAPDENRTYSLPANLKLNQWSLAGAWTIGVAAAVLNNANGKIANRFHARDLHIVMSPPPSGRQVRFRVTIDGKVPGAAHGLDADEQGNGIVTEPRLYQLIRQPGPIADSQFEIEFLEPGVEVYAFTFG